MRVQNLTPFVFGKKHVSRAERRKEMAFFVRAKLVLRPGEPAVPFTFGDVPAFAKAAGPDLDRALDVLAQGTISGDRYADGDDDRMGEVVYPSDFADWKTGADVMLRGAFHAPGGKPVKESHVRFTVGAWSKTLRVVGPRVWVDRFMGGKATDPLEFVTVPIDWAHAWGGPEHADNPAGTGLSSERLAQVERADGERVPASFAPLNPNWPAHAAKLGKDYGAAWERLRAPYAALDMDPAYYRPVPADQRLSAFLRGNETLRFENLHADASSFSVALPKLRIRVALRFDDDRDVLLAMNLDTLFADLAEGALFLTWRGHVPIREDDMSDVKFAVIAQEELGAERPDAYLLEELGRFAADPVGLKEGFPEGFEAAAREAEEREDRDEPPIPPEDAIATLKSSKFGQLLAGVAAKQGIPLDEVLHALDKTVSSEDGKKLLAGAPRAPAKQVPSGMLLEPGATPKIGGAAQLEEALAKNAELERRAGRPPRPIDPRLKAMYPGFREPGDAPREAPGPNANLAGQDLSGRDLSGLDLSGANLEVVDLTRAKLRGTNLRGANLQFARLAHADVSGADFTGADLRGLDLSRAEGGSAIFDGARLDQAVVHKSKLVGARFVGVKGSMATFTECDLERASFERAELGMSTFEKCRLVSADFSRAALVRAHVRGCDASGALFLEARGEFVEFRETRLADARFVGYHGALDAFWLCDLERADFQLAVLRRGQFRELVAKGAKFVGADLREASFYKANLEGASFRLANLMSADLRKAVVTNATFAQANLFSAHLLEAHGTRCDFDGANLARASFQRAEITRR